MPSGLSGCCCLWKEWHSRPRFRFCYFYFSLLEVWSIYSLYSLFLLTLQLTVKGDSSCSFIKTKTFQVINLLLLSRFSRVWLCDPRDGSPPGSPVPGILQARTLEWGGISFSNAWKWKVKVKSLSRVRLLATPWTAAFQVPPSMGFSRQEYWSGVPLPSLK